MLQTLTIFPIIMNIAYFCNLAHILHLLNFANCYRFVILRNRQFLPFGTILRINRLCEIFLHKFFPFIITYTGYTVINSMRASAVMVSYPLLKDSYKILSMHTLYHKLISFIDSMVAGMIK